MNYNEIAATVYGYGRKEYTCKERGSPMKVFAIKNTVSDALITVIVAPNGKTALQRFLREHCMNTGMYEIHKHSGEWVLSSSYGSYFIAKELAK